MSSELQRVASVVGELPSIPMIASQVMEASGNPSTSAEEMRDILEQDPALSLRVLKVANSPLYGFRREVETLRHAIMLLGFQTVESLVLAASLRNVFSNFGLGEKLIWEHSTTAGVVARSLASYGPIQVNPDTAFTAGLLHDLGKIALLNLHRQRYTKIMSRVYNEGLSFVEAEQDEFGFDHAQLGARVADQWRLPVALVRAIEYHHTDPAEFPVTNQDEIRLIALTTLVTQACTKLGHGRRVPVPGIRLEEAPVWQVLGLGSDDLEPLLERVATAASQAEGLFS